MAFRRKERSHVSGQEVPGSVMAAATLFVAAVFDGETGPACHAGSSCYRSEIESGLISPLEEDCADLAFLRNSLRRV